MEIKPAKDEGKSDTLSAARQSERYAAGLVVGAAAAAAIWLAVPNNIKEKMLPFFATAAGGVGFVMKLGLVKIKNGRLSVGDLNEAVSNYALLPPGELKALTALKPVIEGNLKLQELPEVRSIVEAAIGAATQKHEAQKAEFEEKIKAAELKAVVFPKDEVIPTPKPGLPGFRSIKPEEVI